MSRSALPSSWWLLLTVGLLSFLGCGSVRPAAAMAPSPGAASPSHASEANARPSRRTLPKKRPSRAWTGASAPKSGIHALTSPGSLPQLRDPEGHPLPLRHTDVKARLQGHVAQVRVRQTFRNDSDTPIEVVYAFPLPENSAVSELRMKIGDRVVESDIMRRAEAKQTYEQAKAQGHTASLLEQERPNIFTQSVANIAPGEDIEVEIGYLQTLTYDAGQYEFVFPMVVGPRFIPGEAKGHRGDGSKADTDQVPDASRISPPIVGHGTRSGDDISISVEADAGHPIVSWATPTHDVDVAARDGKLRATLAAHDRVPNRDFVLRYRVTGKQAQATAIFGPRDAKGDGHYLMVVHPPETDVDAEVGRREFIFVVDRSGSMSGVPLALAKQTVREMLSHMRPVDSFDVVGFASGTSRLFGTPRPANATNLIIALRFLDGMRSGGGTMMANAVQASLSDEVAEGFNRYVFFLTDGYIGNETEIFAGAEALVDRIANRGQVARVFGVGIGSSPNHHLIEGLSRAGHGVPHHISNREQPTQVVNAVMHKVDRPALTTLRLPEGSPLAQDAYPATLPDLFVSHPVTVMGRYHGAIPSQVKLRAKRGAVGVTIPVAVRRAEDGDRLLSTLWARAKVRDLEEALWHRHDPEVVEQITTLGLEHHLVTAYTSLIAVDRSRTVGKGNPRKVVQPTHAPEGVDPVAAGGEVQVMHKASVGRTISMEEFRNIPVGSSSGRDFAQVVESSASATRDSAGISLAGTTGAQSRYTVEGTRRRGVVRSKVPRQFEQISRDPGRTRGTPMAHVRIGRLEGDDAPAAKVVRRAHRSLRPRLRRCLEGSPMFDREGRTALVLELRVATDGTLTVRILSGTLEQESADRCVERAVAEASWGLSPGVVLKLPLRLWAS